MNGFGDKNVVTDCPLDVCRWTSAPMPTTQAAIEARRKHLADHTHGDLVDFIARQNEDRFAEYVKR